MNTSRIRGLVGACAVASLVLTACSPLAGRGVGSQAPTVTLTFASGNDSDKALDAFAEAAKTASGGTIAIKFVNSVHRNDPSYESAIIDDVVAGTYDLGWVAPRPWHAKGVTSFDALMAPFLIDSYELEGAVLGSELPDQMLAGLAKTGLVGLGILPGPLRRVAMAEGGVKAPGDLRGKHLAVGDSDIARMTFAALGASTRSLPSGGQLEGDDGVEQQLGSITGNRYHRVLGHVTADLAFWPRPLIVFANEARFNGLAEAQKTALRNAIKPLVPVALSFPQAEDAAAIGLLCEEGGDIVRAGASARDAFRAATSSVSDELAKDATTKAMIERITALKQQTAVAASDPSCDVAAASASPSPGRAEGPPDGTYEARASCDEVAAWVAAHTELPAEKRPTSCPSLNQFRLKGNDLMENYGEHWSFTFYGDHVRLGNFTMRWSFDGTRLTLSEIEGGGPDDAMVWTLKPFTKVADDAIPEVGFPNGTYTAKISADEMKAFWDAHSTPVSVRKACPCTNTFTIHDDKWTGEDGSEWTVSFFADKVTLTDKAGSITLRWRNDPQVEEVTFTEVETGDPIEDADLAAYFLAKTFDRTGD